MVDTTAAKSALPIMTTGKIPATNVRWRFVRSVIGPRLALISSGWSFRMVVQHDLRIDAGNHEQQRTEGDAQRQAESDGMSDDWPHELTTPCEVT